LSCYLLNHGSVWQYNNHVAYISVLFLIDPNKS